MGIRFIVHQNHDRAKNNQHVGEIDYRCFEEHKIIRGESVDHAIDEIVDGADDDRDDAEGGAWLCGVKRSGLMREAEDDEDGDRSDDCEWNCEIERDTRIFVEGKCEDRRKVWVGFRWKCGDREVFQYPVENCDSEEGPDDNCAVFHNQTSSQTARCMIPGLHFLCERLFTRDAGGGGGADAEARFVNGLFAVFTRTVCAILNGLQRRMDVAYCCRKLIFERKIVANFRGLFRALVFFIAVCAVVRIKRIALGNLRGNTLQLAGKLGEFCAEDRFEFF